MHPRTQELLDYLERQRAAFREAFDAVPAALRDRPPAPGKWSVAACVEHIAIVEQLVAKRLTTHVDTARAAGLGAETSTDPILPQLNVSWVLNRDTKVNAPEPIHPTGLSADAAVAALEQSNIVLRDAVKACDGVALGGVSWMHPMFGPLTAYQWLAFHGAHEARHAVQIREIAEALATTRQ
jgi:hypothetical protein